MTKKELHTLRMEVLMFHPDVKWKEGYCCYNSDSIDMNDLIPIGRNISKLYGWNWCLYYCIKNNTFYVSGYRNY